MRNVTLVILNSLRIKCHIRRPLILVYYNSDDNFVVLLCSDLYC